MKISFGRPVIRFLTELLYLPEGSGPMELDGTVSGVADVIQQGWARRGWRFSSSAPPTTIGGGVNADPVVAFLDDPAFVQPADPPKAIIQPAHNRLVIPNWTPQNWPTGTPMANPEGVTLAVRMFLFNGRSFDGFTVPADSIVVYSMSWPAASPCFGLFPFGAQSVVGGSVATTVSPFGFQPIFVPAGFGLALQWKRQAASFLWANNNDFGEFRNLVLDVPKEVKPY